MTKILVCGDRNWSNYRALSEVLSHTTIGSAIFREEEVMIIQGGCRGADLMAKQWADETKVQCITFPAEWAKHGRAAGPIRNRRMLDEKPDLVIAFHDDIESSKGTLDTVREAIKRGIPVQVWNSDKQLVKGENYGGDNGAQSRLTDKM